MLTADQNLPFATRSTVELTPASDTVSTKLSGSGQYDCIVLQNACAAIETSWRRIGLSDKDAREQADAFRRRFETLSPQPHPTEAELDATLAIVADAMVSA